MSRTLPTTATAMLAVASLALLGCGDDSDGGDTAAFCAAGQEIQAATADIDSPEAAVDAFSSVSDTIDELVETAPDDVAEDAQAFADHVAGAVDTGDFSAFEDGTVDELSSRMDAACEDR
jgi:hypothetical protein